MPTARTGRSVDRRKPSARQERAWIRDARRGSADAIEALFRWHWPRAHRASYLVVHDSAAAEDIAQESFLAALRNLDGFDRSRPFGPWLHRIVVNRSIDYARLRTLRGEVGTRERDEPVAPPPVVAKPSDGVVAVLASLPLDQRAVVVMRYLLDFTPGEIAATLGLPRGTVNSRLRRGLDALRPLLDGDEL